MLFLIVEAEPSILTRLYEFLQPDTFKTSFSQKVYDERDTLVEDSIGIFAIARPGRFRWEYVHPNRQIIVSDGVNLVTYDPELEQATAQPLAVSLGYAPIMLLLERSPSLDGFEVNQGGRMDGLDWITLVPKVQDMEFTRIELGLDRKKVVRMKMHDHFNQLTVIEFLKSEYNVDFEEETFRLFLPPGTDVIGEYLLKPPS